VAFAGYLAARDARTDGTLAWRVEQGYEMGRPSLLELEADKRGGRISATRVGGSSIIIGSGELALEPATACV
jgi:trans-2,3-dihydro-3-hydroxyanthranilate isomerase